MKALRPYVFKHTLEDSHSCVGATGDVLNMGWEQTNENYYKVRRGEDEEFYVSRWSFEHDFNHDVLSSPWLNDHATKKLCKGKDRTKALLQRVHMTLGSNETRTNFLTFLVKFADVQADIDNAIELLQAVTNCDLKYFSDYSTTFHIRDALSRAVDILEDM